MKLRTLITIVAFTLAGAAAAENVKKTIRSEQKFPLAAGGTFVLENQSGNIEIVGADIAQIEAKIATIVTATTNEALEEGLRLSGLIVSGDAKTRILRAGAGARNAQWSSIIHWSVRIPRTAQVRVVSTNSDRLRIANVNGDVRVRNFNGNVVLNDVMGAAFVESVNGSIVYSTPYPRGNVVLSTVNGHVTATVAGDADLRWVAETARGDIRTNLPARGAFFGPTFRGSVNAPGGPTITTASLMGNIMLLGGGSSATKTESLKKLPETVVPGHLTADVPMASSSGPRIPTFRRTTFRGNFGYTTNIGDVRVQEILGNAQIFTGAGQVQLGSVAGSCTVRSLGGPLQIGEVIGPLNASTRAGDILVDSAARGGTIETSGGTIRLLYVSGPVRLISGGGDIVVRQTVAPVNAETASGDIGITVDFASKGEKIDARTGKGNVVLNVGPKFGADVEATILTSDPKGDTILSDIPGLAISRDQVNGKTRVRAVGKINGGGERVVLSATDGDIRISTGRVAPTVMKPR